MYPGENKNQLRIALTLIEMVIALSIMVIIIAAILPQLKVVNDSWASKQASAEVLQNARVLVDQINRSLSSADRITDVSDPCEADGYIEFEDNTGTAYRMDIAANNYIEFGPVGSLSDLAGPVSRLRFTCYSKDNFTTPTTVAGDIRFVKAEVIFPNPGPGQDRTFTTSTYLRTNAGSSLLGWWKLDETSGLTAADSSGNNNDGTLNSMAGNEWTGGIIDGALEFDGTDDYIDGIGDCPTSSFTVLGWAKDTGPAVGKWSVVYSAEQEIWFGIDRSTSDNTLWVDCGGNRKGANTLAGTWTRNVWHHVAVTWDGSDIHLYLDGVDMPITVYGVPENPLAKAAVIGAYSKKTDDETWYGKLDDIRIYGRALTTEEVASIANSSILFREFTEAKAGSDTTSITIDIPSGTSQDDLLIAAVATDGNTSSSLAPPFGQGWTEIDVGHKSAKVTLGAWWKNADASESPTHQFTWSGSEQAYGWMMRFTGHDPTSPINTSAVTGDSSISPTSPSVTTTVANTMIVRIGGFDDGDITVDDPGLSGHAAITMDASSGSGISQVAILGSWTSGLTHTAEAGANRLLVLTAHVEDNDADMSLDSVTYGGQSMTKVIEKEIQEGSDRAYVVAYILDENGIAAASGNTFSPSWSSTPDQVGYSSVFLANVDQADPTGADSSKSDKSKSTIKTSNLATNDGDMVILAATAGNTGSYSVKNGFTEAIELSITSADGVAGYKQATGASERPKITHSNPYRQVLIGFVVQNGGIISDGMVSGGAGYVRQSSSGDSGTSSFALTASQKSQMITIAITPDPSGASIDLILP